MWLKETIDKPWVRRWAWWRCYVILMWQQYDLNVLVRGTVCLVMMEIFNNWRSTRGEFECNASLFLMLIQPLASSWFWSYIDFFSGFLYCKYIMTWILFLVLMLHHEQCTPMDIICSFFLVDSSKVWAVNNLCRYITEKATSLAYSLLRELVEVSCLPLLLLILYTLSYRVLLTVCDGILKPNLWMVMGLWWYSHNMQ